MSYLLQPTPISCSNCGTLTRPSQQTISNEKETIVEAQWRCPQCGAYLKRGVISRTPKEQKQ